MAGTDVTLAVIGNKLDTVNDKLDAIDTNIGNLDGMVRIHETAIARIQERQKVGAVFQGGFTVIASTIAAFFGARQ